MARSLFRTAVFFAAILTAGGLYVGCSDDECPTCPDDPGGGTTTSLDVNIMHPQPDPIRYNDVYAAAPGAVFIACDAGVVYGWQNDTWTRYDTPALSSLNGIYGPTPSDLYAVGTRGVIVRFDGSTWTSMNSGVLSDLNSLCSWGPVVIAVGNDNTVLRYAGAAWEPMDLGLPEETRHFKDIFGFSATNVYVAGWRYGPAYYGGTLPHFDGSTWTETTFGNYLNTVWGVIAGDTVYVGDDAGNVWQKRGAEWVSQPLGSDNVRSIWGTAWNDVWAVGSRWDDIDWVSYGTIHHYHGTGWHDVGGESVPYPLRAVHARSANEAYAVGDQSIIMDWDGSVWEPLNDAWVTGSGLNAVWGFDSGELFALGYNGTMIQYDGSEWSEIQPVTDQSIQAVWGLEPDTLYAVGSNSTTLFYDGTNWQSSQYPINVGTLNSIWGTSSSDIRVGGDYGLMLHFSGTMMVVDTLQDASGGSIRDIWGSAPDDYYAVVNNGVLHYDGTSWTPIPLDGRQVNAVHGVSATEVYFAGGSSGPRDLTGAKDAKEASKIAGPRRKGFLLRYDGSTYTVLVSDMEMDPSDVWAAGTGNVFLGGSTADVFALGHYNGSGIAIGTSSASYRANGIWATGNTAVGVGPNGLVARVNGQ